MKKKTGFLLKKVERQSGKPDTSDIKGKKIKFANFWAQRFYATHLSFFQFLLKERTSEHLMFKNWCF